MDQQRAIVWKEGAVELEGVRVRYRSHGQGSPIVFVHGVWVGGSLWEDVVPHLPDHDCILPTWPLGAHRDPSPSADLTARTTARRIPAFLEALDLDDVTLVGNDTGGGLCLAALGTDHPGLDRIGRLVLTNCDSYEHFPPKGFDTMVALTRAAPLLGKVLLRSFVTGAGRSFFLKAVCANPPKHARRLEADFPDASLEVIQEASTFVMLDQPRELASAIAQFIDR